MSFPRWLQQPSNDNFQTVVGVVVVKSPRKMVMVKIRLKYLLVSIFVKFCQISPNFGFVFK